MATLELTQRDIALIRGEKARRSLYDFMKTFWHVVEPGAPFVPGIHIEALCDHIEHLKDIRNLIIAIPPRSSKSLTACVFAPAWNWLAHPEDRYLYSSYSLQLSTRDSVKTRTLIESDLYQAAYGHIYQLTGDQNTKTRFNTDKGGFRLATSVEGSNVGEGATFLCLPPEARIRTELGDLPIGEIVEKKLNVNVLAYDHGSRETCHRPVTHHFRREGKFRLCRVLTERGEVKLTEDHPVYVSNLGYVPAERVRHGDHVLTLVGDNVVSAFVLSVAIMEEVFVVYNIEVGEHNNYFAEGILCHNCCDDANNIQDVESKSERDSTNRWWSSVFCTRLNNPATGCRLVIGQRCHPNDLIGYITSNDKAGDWTKLVLPTEYGKCGMASSNWVDPRKVDGELLCPARLPQVEVDFLKGSMGSRSFNSQFNQQPASPEDALFHEENFKYYDPTVYKKPDDAYRLAAVDLAVAAKGDHSAVTVGDVHPDGSLYMIEVIRRRTPGLSILDVLEDIHIRLKPVMIYVEDVGYQRIIIDEARSRRLPVRGVRPGADKVSRSCHLQALSESGRLWFPKGATWLGAMEEEMLDFDGREGAADDIVDSASHLAMEASKFSRRRPEEVKETPEEKAALQRAEVDRMREAQRKAFFSGL